MIKVNKDYEYIPKSLNSKTIAKKKNDLLKLKNGSEATGYNSKDVQNELRKIYNNKCCFCESKEKKDNYTISFDIEHYRPKSKYYWLAFEWSNLLWSCQVCNRNYKKTQFPVKNQIHEPNINSENWKANSLELLSEEPFLLNPEIDDIEQHIEFNCNGEIKGKTVRGEKTIEICGLQRLKTNRKTLIDDIFQKLENQIDWLYEYVNKNKIEVVGIELIKLTFKEIFENIEKNKNPEFEFSGMYKDFYNKFDEFCKQTEKIKNQNTKHFIINSFNKLSK